MKKLLSMILCLAVFCFVAGAFCFAASPGESKVIVYYFHGSFRCASCRDMEKFAKEALEANFKDELASGVLEFKPVNVEKEGNEHYVNQYQLYSKALILSRVEDGKETRSKNLTKIWDYVRNKKKFSAYVTEETRLFLERAR
ncbi:MAG: nitrophenyl compound nitroreductase subunit ArsF family protein [Candidatus Omnitrophota bacterium]